MTVNPSIPNSRTNHYICYCHDHTTVVQACVSVSAMKPNFVENSESVEAEEERYDPREEQSFHRKRVATTDRNCAAVQLTPVKSEHMYSMVLALRCGSCRPPTLPYKIQKPVTGLRSAKSAGPDARFDLACELPCNPLGRPPLRMHTVPPLC